jgi:dihydrofolate reductase
MTSTLESSDRDVALIAAVASNRVIGDRGALPWRLPEEMRFFTATTLGHPVVMGRKTYESIGRPLPKRRNLVVSGDTTRRVEGVEFTTSLSLALALCDRNERIFVIGGAGLYREAMPLASWLYLTEIFRDYPGDTTFPEIPGDFVEHSRTVNYATSEPGLRFDFVVYKRR